MDGKRIARNAENEVYYVPSSMNYQTWKKTFVDGGSKAGLTAAAADTLDYMDEDLAWMKDIAEREAINRFTTAEIKVEQHNENHISKDTDLDGVMEAFCVDFAEKLDVSAEGVHE